MTVEIVDASVKNKIVTINAIDVSEENLQRLERERDDGFEKEVSFVFDTTDKKTLLYLQNFMRRQKITSGCNTWGQALQAIAGTHTSISGKYRVWD